MKTDIKLQELRQTKALEATLTTDMKTDLGPHESRETKKALEATLTTDVKPDLRPHELRQKKKRRRERTQRTP